MKKLAVGVAGVGYLGRFHALIYSRHPDVDLVGVADTDPATAQAVAGEAGCEAFTDPAELIDRVDAVSIVVPTTAHLAITRPFLEAGRHVLLESRLPRPWRRGARSSNWRAGRVLFCRSAISSALTPG